MQQGASTEIVSLRPKNAENKEDKVKKDQELEHSLRVKAKAMVLIDSDAGQTIWKNLADLLTARIEKLIAADPEAKAIKDMIDSLGAEYNQAKLAVEALQQRYTKD